MQIDLLNLLVLMLIQVEHQGEYYTMDIKDNAIWKQANSLPELLLQQYEDLEPKTRKVLTTPEIFSVQRIVLVGCGDSYAAALATKHAFEMLTDIPTEAVTAIELARLYSTKQLGFAPNNPLVIGISNSGEVARLAEALQRASALGAFTLAVTGNENSAVAKSAERILRLEIPPFAPSVGVRSYQTSVLALLLLAIRIGEVRGKYTMDKAMEMRLEIPNQANILKNMFSEMDERIGSIAKKWVEFSVFDFAGAGFDYAAAWYGHAKVMEALGLPATQINSEEWLHLNFFMRDVEKIGTVLIANTTNPSHSRNLELVRHMAQMGRPVLVVTNGGYEDFAVENITYVKVPACIHPILMPLTQFVPLALLAAHLQNEIGEVDGRGCQGPWKFAQGGAGVKQSEIQLFL